MKNEKLNAIKRQAMVVVGVTATAAVCVTGVLVMANNWHKTLEANGLPGDIYDPR